MPDLIKSGIPADPTGPYGLHWVQTRQPAPRGLVFIPPLIGGGPAQQLQTFRWLVKDGFDLFSFNFAGHGVSGGKFSLGASVTDTRRMLALAAERAAGSGLPLYGICACYSTIPMLAGAAASGEPFKKLILINPLSALQRWTLVRSVVAYCKAGFDLKSPLRSVKQSIDRYLERLFPEVSRSTAGFGSLSRKRARILKILVEWLCAEVRLDFPLRKTPVLCLYGRRDPILHLGGNDPGTNHLQHLRAICSQVTFHAINSDHFLSDPESRAMIRKSIRSFLK